MNVDMVENQECITGSALPIVIHIVWVIGVVVRCQISMYFNDEFPADALEFRQCIADADGEGNLILVVAIQHLAIA